MIKPEIRAIYYDVLLGPGWAYMHCDPDAFSFRFSTYVSDEIHKYPEKDYTIEGWVKRLCKT